MAVGWDDEILAFALISVEGIREGRMISIENISKKNSAAGNRRRDFLKGLLSAGAFVLSARLMPEPLFGATGTLADSAGDARLQPNVYLAIDTKGTAFIIAHRSEMGSGSRTALPRIVADELDADWARVKLVQAIGDENMAIRTPTGRTRCAASSPPCANPGRPRD